MTRTEKIAFVLATSDLFRCPNSGLVIDGAPGDDKVACACGKANPKTPYREAAAGVVHHVKKYLERATAEEFVDQEDKRRGE